MVIILEHTASLKLSISWRILSASQGLNCALKKKKKQSFVKSSSLLLKKTVRQEVKDWR